MRLLTVLAAVVAGALLVAHPALAQFEASGSEIYIGDQNRIDASHVEHVSATSVSYGDYAQLKSTYYERAFFTPVPNFSQPGYQCTGTVSVSYVGRIRHLHRGTYCMR